MFYGIITTILCVYAVLTIPIVLVAIRARRSHAVPVDPILVPTDGDSLSAETRSAIASSVNTLRELGFAVIANVDQKEAVGNMRSVLIVSLRSESSDLAKLILAIHASGRLVGRTLVYQCESADGRRIVTGSTPTIGFLPPYRKMHVISFPYGIDDRILYSIHRHHVREAALQPREILPPADELGFVRDDLKRGLHDMVKTGYHQIDGDVLRLSWYGVIFVILKHLPGVLQFRHWLRHRQAAALELRWRSAGSPAL